MRHRSSERERAVGTESERGQQGPRQTRCIREEIETKREKRDRVREREGDRDREKKGNIYDEN